MSQDVIKLLCDSWLIVAILMVGQWGIYLYKDEPSVVDIGWGIGIGVACFWMYQHVPSLASRQTVVFICVLIWSVRLVSLLLGRLQKNQIDVRYTELSASWVTGLHWKYFLFFQAQAASVAVLVVPCALAYLAPMPSWTVWDTAGLLLFIVGFAGETAADDTMARFRSTPENRGKVCDVGLWHYSRHPNYFFETCIWVSYALFAMNSPMWLYGWVSPILILVSILKVTGIPPTEARLLASKGDAYRAYMKKTSSFIPWPPSQQ